MSLVESEAETSGERNQTVADFKVHDEETNVYLFSQYINY